MRYILGTAVLVHVLSSYSVVGVQQRPLLEDKLIWSCGATYLHLFGPCVLCMQKKLTSCGLVGNVSCPQTIPLPLRLCVPCEEYES